MKKKGFTLIELLVVIAIIAMLLAILMPALSKVKKIAQRVVCGTNLKGLGTAQTVYANDYSDQYAVLSANLWGKATGNFDEQAGVKTFPSPTATIGASLYLLVREADVSPKSFVCPAGGQTAYGGENRMAKDITELWDFGVYAASGPATPDTGIANTHGPRNHVSYAYQMPYGPQGGRSRFAADATRGASFATMADKNPWYDPKLDLPPADGTNWSGKVRQLFPHWEGGGQRWQILVANAYPHGRDGQNVLFADGHTEFARTADVGVKNDNIYTIQDPANSDVLRRVRMGNFTIGYNINPQIQPQHIDDSWLVNDDARDY